MSDKKPTHVGIVGISMTEPKLMSEQAGLAAVLKKLDAAYVLEMSEGHISHVWKRAADDEAQIFVVPGHVAAHLGGILNVKLSSFKAWDKDLFELLRLALDTLESVEAAAPSLIGSDTRAKVLDRLREALADRT